MPQVSLKAFIASAIAPFSIDRIFEWPPDVFAMTSAVLRATGAYRHLISPPPPHQWPTDPPGKQEDTDWDTATNQAAVLWLESIADLAPLILPEWLRELRADLTTTWETTTIEDLRNIECAPGAWDACRVLLSLHAIADSACNGFGTPVAPRQLQVIHFLADHLLSTYGSLSRLPKASGIVLPKMRTPQSGLTLRACSLFVTWHQTEVEAVWRSTPWVNAEENTLNVLIVPWPTEVQPHSFQRNTHPAGMRNLGRDRYFSYASTEKLDVDKVVSLVLASAPLASRIHLIVLPELALDHGEYRTLQLRLAEQLPPDRVPLIIAGVRTWHVTGTDKPSGAGAG